MESTPTSATVAPEPKRTWFETVVISTPVLLTVIATFMVGQSSSEMTKAQYFRSVASQNQSKVGDQWGFFQAKRIRGQILEGNAGQLLAQKRSLFSRDTLVDAAEGMVIELRAAEKSLGNSAPAPIARDLKELVASAEEALTDTRKAFDGGKNVQAALDALQPKPARKSKGAKETKAGSDKQAALLDDIISDIQKRKSDGEMALKVLELTDATLDQTLKEAEGRAEEVAERGKDVENVLEEFDALVDRQTALARSYQQIIARLRPSAGKADTDALREVMEQRADVIRGLNAKLQGDYMAVRNAFSARRYELDARSNQRSAYLYEVKVRQSSVRSDKHLVRSQLFLFAMLVAQAGVTIATLALAVKRRSIFWLLAALTGVVAMVFGAYLLLDMPMPGL